MIVSVVCAAGHWEQMNAFLLHGTANNGSRDSLWVFCLFWNSFRPTGWPLALIWREMRCLTAIWQVKLSWCPWEFWNFLKDNRKGMDLGYRGSRKTGHKEEKTEGKLGLKRQELTSFLSLKTAFLAIIANASNVIKYLLHRKIKSYIGQTILYQPHKLYFL